MPDTPMFEIPSTEAELRAIRDLALAKARALAGDDAVLEAEVEEGGNIHGEPAYKLTFLVDPTRIEQKLGQLGLGRFRVGVDLDITHELFARRDPHRLVISLMDQEDWPKRLEGNYHLG